MKLDMLESWINDQFDQVRIATDEILAQIEEEDTAEAISFMSNLHAQNNIVAEPEISRGAYVYSGMGLAVVATAAYFMYKKQ